MRVAARRPRTSCTLRLTWVGCASVKATLVEGLNGFGVAVERWTAAAGGVFETSEVVTQIG